VDYDRLEYCGYLIKSKSGLFHFFFEPSPQSFEFAFWYILIDISAIQTNIRSGFGTGHTEDTAGDKDIGHTSDTQVSKTQIFTPTGHTA
jgi:hypothetical protein